MKRTLVFVSAVFMLAFMGAITRSAGTQEKPAGRTIKVHVLYSGAVHIDATHKIYLALWDSPAFMQQATRPIGVQSIASKDDTVTFTDVQVSPAYVSAALDPAGQWDGASGPPPTGSFLGLYSKGEGKPEPIAVDAGSSAEVTLNMDDSYKMPAQ